MHVTYLLRVCLGSHGLSVPQVQDAQPLVDARAPRSLSHLHLKLQKLKVVSFYFSVTGAANEQTSAQKLGKWKTQAQ